MHENEVGFRRHTWQGPWGQTAASRNVEDVRAVRPGPRPLGRTLRPVVNYPSMQPPPRQSAVDLFLAPAAAEQLRRQIRRARGNGTGAESAVAYLSD